MMRKWYYSEIAVISIFIVLMLATVGGVSFWYVQEEGQQQTKIRMPRSAEQLKGENYRDVITLLETAGFRNIETVILNDLVIGWLTKDGEVERVSVNGETSFYSGSRFPVDAKIVVTYHTFTVTTSKKTDPITPQTSKAPPTPSATERISTVVSKPAETKTRSTAWAIETYGGITFKIDSSWKKEIDDNGSYLYFPPIAEPTGVIACTNIRQERLKGDLSDGDIRYLLDRLESFLIGSEEEIKPIGSKREISRAYLKIGDKNAIRVSYYLQEKNDTNGDERVRLDRVIVLFEDGFTSLDSLFQITGYDSYKNTIESTLSSIQLGSTAYSSSSPSSQPSVITISAPAIVKDYVDNEIAANHKYEGKNVRITAKIKDIGKDILGNPYITFSDGEEYSFRSVQCYFKKSEQAKIGTLRKEQTVTIDGTVDGLMMNVLLKDCVFKD